MSRTQRRWSAQEDLILQKEVETQIADHGTVRDWNIISQKVEGRTNKDCRKRFYNGITEGLRKGPWKTDEDQLLERLVKKYGSAWAVIAQEFETRSADQCSKRWQHCLDPELDRSRWSVKENLALLVAVKTHESAWKDIQTLHFPSRSANNVKNQYSVLKRQNLELPQNTPSCCTTPAEQQKDVSACETNASRVLEDSSNMLDQFDLDMDPAFDGLIENNHGNSQLEYSYFYSNLEGKDVFQRLGTDVQSRAITTERLNDDFEPSGLQGGSPMNMARSQPFSRSFDREHFDFHMEDGIPGPLAYPQTEPNTPSNSCADSTMNASQSIRRRGHLSDNPFEWPTSLDSEHPQHQQQGSGSSGNQPSSSTVTTNLQTTIKLEGADQSTISAVMGVLIKSKAKFKFETR